MTALSERRPVEGPGTGTEPALLAYERCAEYYDVLTADYDHETWTEAIIDAVRGHGGRGRRLLDVGCGTGKSSLPFVRRGYDVQACDVSPAMVRRARIRLPESVDVFVADMRALPQEREFDLITCLDDALNYLLRISDVGAAMRSFASALVPGGIAVFDLNTPAAYRDAFGPGSEAQVGGGRLRWRGQPIERRGVFAAAIEPVGAVAGAAAGRWRSSLHVQRYHPPARIQRCCRAAGLEVLAIYGQSPGARLHERYDEWSHTKLLYVVRNGSDARRGGDRP